MGCEDVEHSQILIFPLSDHLRNQKMSCSLLNPVPVGSGRCQLPKQHLSLRPSLSTHFPGALSRHGWRAKMVGPVRPKFVLFGSSIVQFSFGDRGWGADIADLYSRQADVILRGYGGWNSSRALQVVDEIFPKDSIIQPSLVIVYFGGNDAVIPLPFPGGSHVPLPEFINNMTNIVCHIKSLSATTRSIFLTPPPVNSEQIRELMPGLEKLRTMENLEIYTDAIIDICRDIGVEYVDLFRAVQRRDDWLTFFTDGVHFNEEGSRVVFEEIKNTINRANWVPSLAAGSMPIEFENIRRLGSFTFEGSRIILD
ncbi:GDSL esterase/lipase CPRD49-like [Momordica charantia]|uniref:GDSL esterase/lipase CPRD49-like n=1 Tax=Momordica charantia TaxID=3673 RepID=A0A6J1CW36_MOMCH|nr:GDSL esterase/lipase CPRD49-like [Momordica charantia]